MGSEAEIAMLDAMIRKLRERKRALGGYKPSGFNRNEARWQAIGAAYMAGHKIRNIAADFNTSHGFVVRVVRILGLSGQRRPGRRKLAA